MWRGIQKQDFSEHYRACSHEHTMYLRLRFNVQAKQDLLGAVLQKVERNGKNEANYEQFLQLLNWRDSPGES